MLTIHRQCWYRRDLRTRLPFRYGIAVMEEVPHVWLELEATIDGERVSGRSADHLPPKWFTKDPARTLAEEVDEMQAVLRSASAAAAGLEAASVHAAVQHIEAAQAYAAAEQGWPPLLSHFGVSLVERALIDAFCRRHGRPVGAVLRDNGLGIELGDLHEELNGTLPAQGLPPQALTRVQCRHTVGLSDPLVAGDVSAAERPEDGLPVELAAVIAHYGLREFKIKVAGDPADALDRLERVVAVIEAARGGDYAATLDGNESFAAVEDLQAFWEAAHGRPGLARFWSRLRFLEQPLHRSVALGEAVAAALPAWTDRPRLLIDESGATPADLRRALEIGYIGVSHKNCKGVIHGVANRCLLAYRESLDRGGPLEMSGEDLSNVGPVALTQDLAVQAALGNASVERNGHHYFAGLAGWPATVGERAQAAYPDLYDAVPGLGAPAVQVRAGEISTAAVGRGAFGGPWDLGLAEAGERWATVD